MFGRSPLLYPVWEPEAPAPEAPEVFAWECTNGIGRLSQNIPPGALGDPPAPNEILLGSGMGRVKGSGDPVTGGGARARGPGSGRGVLHIFAKSLPVPTVYSIFFLPC